MSNQDLDIDALKTDLQRKMRNQRRVGRIALAASNAGMWLLFNIFSAAFIFNDKTTAALKTLSGDVQGFIGGALFMLSIGWATGVVFHILGAVMETGIMDKYNKRMMLSRSVTDQLLTQIEAADPVKAKRKNEEMRLSDEGELVPIDQNAETAEQKRTSRGAR